MIKHLTAKTREEQIRGFTEFDWRTELYYDMDSYIDRSFNQSNNKYDRENILYFLLNTSINFPDLTWNNINNKLFYFYKKHKAYLKQMSFNLDDFNEQELKDKNPLFKKLKESFYNRLERFGENKFGDPEECESTLQDIVDQIIINVFFSIYMSNLTNMIDEYKEDINYLFDKNDILTGEFGAC
jgi:hypothetical protein